MSALTVPASFPFFFFGVGVLQCGIPWEISSYFAWLKQTYSQITEQAGMRIAGPELLNISVYIILRVGDSINSSILLKI